MSSYIPRLSDHGREVFDKEIKEDRRVVAEELAKCDSPEQVSGYRKAAAKGFKSKAADLLEEVHMYVREAHGTKNSESSQRINNMRTTTTLSCMSLGLIMRSTTNVLIGA